MPLLTEALRMLLPSDPKSQKIINDAINEAVISKGKQDFEKEHQDAIAEMVEEKTGMSKSEFKKRVNIRYQDENSNDKYADTKEWAENAYQENELLKKAK